ncbi:MAG TPA: hypothetical protein VMF89_21620, partial [Polyangiales bacterium]|nr:hypothetical protein [Polyangiales bacterium]
MNIRIEMARLARVMLLALSCACGDDDSAPSDNMQEGADQRSFHILAAVDEETYVAPAKNLSSGEVTLVGSGTELGAVYAGDSDGRHLYLEDFDANELQKWAYDGDRYEKVDALVLTALSGQGSFRTVKVMDEDTLLLMTWPDSEGLVDWALIDIRGFNVESKGSFTMEPVDGYNAVEVGSPVVRDGKVYLGAMYWVEESQEFPQKMYSIILDYPAFENLRVIESDVSLGATGGWNGQ